jgi:3-hydroxybutyryl-CoA dehydrogenase
VPETGLLESADLCNSPEVSSLLKQVVEKGDLGAKTGVGLYDWTPGRLAGIKKAREEALIEWMKKDRAKKVT